MTTTRFLWTTLAALGGVTAVIGFRATAQEPSLDVRVVEAREDGVVIERSADGKVVRWQKGMPQPPGFTIRSADGRNVYQYPIHGGPAAQDEESKKLIEQEQTAAQEARTLASQANSGSSDGEQADAKKKLREKLAQIFDLQQQRRNHEIQKIEDRLAKLKETLKKREAVKDSIVDRRVETMTGGVDELGWEETFPGAGQNVLNPNLNVPTLPAPVPVPPGPGRFAPTTTLPPPVAPGPGADPAADFPSAAPLPPTAPRAAAPAPAAEAVPTFEAEPAATPAPSLTPSPLR
jgi:hypothetical protein